MKMASSIIHQLESSTTKKKSLRDRVLGEFRSGATCTAKESSDGVLYSEVSPGWTPGGGLIDRREFVDNQNEMPGNNCTVNMIAEQRTQGVRHPNT